MTRMDHGARGDITTGRDGPIPALRARAIGLYRERFPTCADRWTTYLPATGPQGVENYFALPALDFLALLDVADAARALGADAAALAAAAQPAPSDENGIDRFYVRSGDLGLLDAAIRALRAALDKVEAKA